MLPKISNFIKIKNITSVETYGHGLKPSNVPEKGREIEKVSKKLLGHIKTLKHLLLKHNKKSPSEKNMIHISPSLSSKTLTDEADNQKNIAHKKK